MRSLFVLVFLAGPAAATSFGAWQTVTVGREALEVSVAADKSGALVRPQSRKVQMTVRGVEQAAAQASGCRASADNKVKMWVGGDDREPINLNTLEGGVVAVRLRC